MKLSETPYPTNGSGKDLAEDTGKNRKWKSPLL